MKLRIRDNSVRLRLTRSEVTRLYQHHSVEAKTCFGPHPDQVFTYRIEVPEAPEVNETADGISADYRNRSIVVKVPRSQLEAWCTTDQIALKAQQDLKGSKRTLNILIEKDFFCLKPRQNEVEDESDMFPHPHAGIGVC